MEYDHGDVSLEAGSVLVLYTDGVTDAANEEDQHFGNERFKAVVRQNIDKPAQEILDAVYQATLAFRATAEQFDDFTLIVCKCTQ